MGKVANKQILSVISEPRCQISQKTNGMKDRIERLASDSQLLGAWQARSPEELLSVIYKLKLSQKSSPFFSGIRI